MGHHKEENKHGQENQEEKKRYPKHEGHPHQHDSEAKTLAKDHEKLGYYTEDSPKIDPLLLSDNHISEDYYSLVWVCLKKEVWETAEFYGEPIFMTSSNLIRLFLDFLLFMVLILTTVSILLFETFTTLEFKFANYRIEILRILLVFFAQKLLSPEYHKGREKLRYTLIYSEEFSHPKFAIFVSCCQIMMSCINYICIVIFMCLSNTALPLVMHFAEVAVLIEFDDWVGEMICKEFPDEGEKPKDLDLTDVNEKMPVNSKIALVREELRVINDKNIKFDNCLLNVFGTLISWFPWSLLPFVSTLGFEYVIQLIQPELIIKNEN